MPRQQLTPPARPEGAIFVPAQSTPPSPFLSPDHTTVIPFPRTQAVELQMILSVCLSLSLHDMKSLMNPCQFSSFNFKKKIIKFH